MTTQEPCYTCALRTAVELGWILDLPDDGRRCPDKPETEDGQNQLTERCPHEAN